ncbi:tetratricopeptide repeat protein [bacterium]|nr:tetratricopeptide repeat protein [bacterium]
MLTPRKKISRKELQQDPLLNKIATVSDFTQANRQTIMRIAMAVGAVAVIIYAYVTYHKSQNEESINKLVSAEQIYFSGDYREAIRRLEKFCTEYEGTTGGSAGTYYLANSYFNTDQYDFALTNYEKYIDDYGDNEVFTVSSMLGIAACYEGLNKYQEAVDQYEKTLKKYSDNYNKAEIMMSLARAYRVMNQSDNAKTWYGRIVKEFPETSLSREAKSALEELGS